MSDKTPNTNFPVTVDYLKKKYVPPEETNKIHYHPYYEMLIVSSGFVTYATDSGIIKIAKKALYLCLRTHCIIRLFRVSLTSATG